MIDKDKITETEIIKAVKHCEIHQCNECPFEECASCCVAVLEYLTKNNEKRKEGQLSE